MQSYLRKYIPFLNLQGAKQIGFINKYRFSIQNYDENEENFSEEEIFSSEDEELEKIDDNAVKGEYITSDHFNDHQEKNFIDRVKLTVTGGKGGDGCYTFYRDRIIVAGAPDGGDGGNGGSIYFKATPFFKDLRHLKKPNLEGNKGRGGGKLKRNGKNGKDIHVSVPIGTLVWEMKTVQKNEDAIHETDNSEKEKGRSVKISAIKRKLLADLHTNNATVLAARGGLGGYGNAAHPGQRSAGKGKPGQEVEIFLELKSIADIGLVGFPNAGKSTVLATFTRALAKIAPYPFTTLQPTVGNIKFIDDFEMTIADIPGLIEGSHMNKGLGHDFLKHIERTKVLMYVIDITVEDPAKEFRILQRELEQHNKKIFEGKPFILVLNKIDLIQDSEAIIKNLKQMFGIEVVGISAKHSLNLDQIVVKLRNLVENQRKSESERIKKDNNSSMQ